MRQSPVPLESTVVWLVVEEHYSMVSNQGSGLPTGSQPVEIRVDCFDFQASAINRLNQQFYSVTNYASVNADCSVFLFLELYVSVTWWSHQGMSDERS